MRCRQGGVYEGFRDFEMKAEVVGSAIGVGVDEEEDDHAEGHEVGVDTEDDTGVVEVPTALNAAEGVDGAEAGEDGEDSDEWIGTAVGKAGERD